MTSGRVGVLGAGTMGRGIAQLAALGGYETVLYDADREVLENVGMAIGDELGKGVTRGRWSEEEAEAALHRFETAPNLEGLLRCELVVEAAPERLDLKQEVFRSLAAELGSEPVFATNTSSLRVGDIAAGVPNPERVVGMHFFNPPPLMRLVEIVAAESSSEAALVTAAEVAKRMGRIPIRAKDRPGFVANRLARPFTLESLRMLGDGVADVATIDRAVRLGGGFRMGPFELLDLIGLDVNLEIARSFFAQGGEVERWRPSPIQEQLVAEGRFGRKSGHGYYGYGIEDERDPDPDLGIEAPTLDPEALARIDPAAEEILTRLFAQITNEAAFAREEKIAAEEDMETAMRLGFNWPLGPIAITALIGPPRAVEVLDRLRVQHGEAYAAAPRLRAEAEKT